MPDAPSGRNQPVKQHYLPQFYLRNFMKNDELWVRDLEQKETRKQSPQTSAWKRNYYSVKEGEEWDHRIEGVLAFVEGQTKPIIDTVVRGEKISRDQKLTLSLFVALLTTRVPEFQKWADAVGTHFLSKFADSVYSTVEDIQKSIDEYQLETGKKLATSAEQMFEAYHSGKIKFMPTRTHSLTAMLNQAPVMAEDFSKMIWVVGHCAEGCSFITSDNPLIIVPPLQNNGDYLPGPCGILTPGALKVVSLSQSCCLLMQDTGTDILHRRFTTSTVRNINRQIAFEVNRFMFGRDKALLDSIAKMTKDESSPRSSRIRIL